MFGAKIHKNMRIEDLFEGGRAILLHFLIIICKNIPLNV